MWPALTLRTDVYEDLLQSFEKAFNHFNENAKEKLNDMMKVLSIPPRYTTLRCLDADANLSLVKTTINENELVRSGGYYNVYMHAVMADVVIVESMSSSEVDIWQKEVVVDVSCAAAVLRGSDIFIPGILSISPDTRRGDAVSIYVDLEGKCLRGLMQPFGGDKLLIASGVSMVSRKDVFSSLQGPSNGGIGVEVHQNVFQQAPSLDHLLPSILFPQNLPSLVCVHVLSPMPASMVLDMCAAPGGKTSHIATLVGEKGRVVALDKNTGKVHRLRQNLQRLNLSNVDVYVFDANRCYAPDADVSSQPPFPGDFFDCILVDAPCSGLGQRPCLSHRTLTSKQLASYPVVQKKILKNAFALLKPGGVLVYSTCTINPEENEAVVAWALQHFPKVSLQKQAVHLGGCGWRWEGLREDECRMLQRFDPSILSRKDSVSLSGDEATTASEAGLFGIKKPHALLHESLITPETDTIGFFIAKFTKEL